MGKAVMLSIHPKWVGKIVDGEKTIEIRKTKPKIETPFKCYIYCTQSGEYVQRKSVKNIWINRGTGNRFIGNGKVIGEFICDNIYTVEDRGNRFVAGDDVYLTNIIAKASFLDFDDMKKYADGRKVLYAWHIYDLKIYDEPKELSDFQSTREKCEYMSRYGLCLNEKENPLKRPPQSWCYVEEQ